MLTCFKLNSENTKLHDAELLEVRFGSNSGLKVLKELSNEFERILKAHPPIYKTSLPGAQAGESGMVQRVDSMVTPCYQCSGGNKETPQSTNTNTK